MSVGMSVWDSLAGQESAVALLRGAVVSGNPGHAWLVVGPAGSGRSLAARAFAASLQCEVGVGCGQCTACREVAARSHPDVTVLATDALSYGVDEIRGLVPVVQSRPQLGRWRVVILEDADRLTESAANVLLKPLEEPGAATVIVLCAPAEVDVLPTIRSRCRVAALRLPRVAEVAAVLEAEGIDTPTALLAAAAAQGHVGRARRLARDEDARQRRNAVLRLPQALATVSSALQAAAELVRAAEAEATAETGDRDATETAELKEALGVGVRGVSARGAATPLRELDAAHKSRTVRAKRDVLDRALVDLAAFYRDVLVEQFGAVGVGYVHPDQQRAIRSLAEASTPAAILRCVDAVLECRQAIDANVAPLLACEAMALQLRATR